MERPTHLGLRLLAVAAVLGLTTGGALAASAGAQASNAPGITAKGVTLGHIPSETGVAASASEGSARGCTARIDAQNAKGGLKGRKINLQAIDDQSSNNLTAAQDLVRNRNAFIVINGSSAISAISWSAARITAGMNAVSSCVVSGSP
jgi:branched-chain amino acid transport system substrate-binding protein